MYIFPAQLTLTLLLLAAAGCLSSSSVDRGVQRAVRSTGGVDAHSLADAAVAGVQDSGLPKDGPIVLKAPSALALAVEHSRSLQSDREALYLEALSLMRSRRALGLQLEGGISWSQMVSGADEGNETGGANFSLSDTLFTGASLTLEGSSDLRAGGGEEETGRNFGSQGTLSLSQPLLEGAGYAASHEEQIQAERNLAYALRSFAQQRQDFAISTLRELYSLVDRQATLENTRKNLEQSVYLRRRSEAMFKVQLAPYIDVLRSQQQEMSAQNRVADSEAAFANGVRRYLVELGLDVDLAVQLEAEVPPLQRLRADVKDCIALGLEQRLDLKNSMDQLEDAQRQLRLDRNRMLPNLEVFGEQTLRTQTEGAFPGEGSEDELRAGLRLDLPLDLRDERDAVKRSRITLAQARRSYEAQQDTVRLEIIENVNRLENYRRTVEIEQRNNFIARRRVENAVFRFKAGELSNRDVVEAEDELLSARNALVRALIDHEIERLRLLRNMGLLEMTVEGLLLENPEVGGSEPDAEKQSLFEKPEVIVMEKASDE